MLWARIGIWGVWGPGGSEPLGSWAPCGEGGVHWGLSITPSINFSVDLIGPDSGALVLVGMGVSQLTRLLRVSGDQDMT